MYTRCVVVSVMALGSNVDDSKQGDEVCDTRQEDGSIAVSADSVEDTAVDNSDHTDSASYKRRSLKGKPRIPSAVDTSRLNKQLTNIWSSKRKKTTKKVVVDSPKVFRSDLPMESEVEMSDHVDAADKSTAVDSQASTVIIVKTLTQKEAESHHSPPMENKVPVGEVQKGSRDIAERLRARKERLAASLGDSSLDGSLNRSGQVTCELCAETVDDYAQLVRHVCEQHQDCTYVRSYLDEIQPIADALSAVSLPCKECGRTFAGQAALAAHRHECSSVSKLGAHRRRISASLLSPSEHAGDHSRQNGAAKRSKKAAPVPDDSKCVHCKRTFSTQEKLARHVVHVHNKKDLKQRGNRNKLPAATTTSKSAAVAGSQLKKQPKAAQSSSVTASTGSQFQRCDHCSACFSRTSLLVTHMRYCLKADSNS